MTKLYKPKPFQLDPKILPEKNEKGFFEEADLSYRRKGIPQVYFEEMKEDHWQPRAVLVDSEPELLDKVHQAGLTKIFSPD